VNKATDFSRLRIALKSSRVFSKFTLGDSRRVVLREAELGDLDKLLAFINGLVSEKRRDEGAQLFTGFESRVGRRQEAEWLHDLVRRGKKGDAISVLAEVDGMVVGNGEISRGSYRETRHHGHLGLTIRGAYRGLGIGREMVRVLLAEARRKGLRTVHVEFLSTNKAAVRVYEKAGFKKVGNIPGKVFRNGRFLDSLIMARRL
jgi:RimJ/RimL family protein N-acetyltransferase